MSPRFYQNSCPYTGTDGPKGLALRLVRDSQVEKVTVYRCRWRSSLVRQLNIGAYCRLLVEMIDGFVVAEWTRNEIQRTVSLLSVNCRDEKQAGAKTISKRVLIAFVKW